MCSLMKISLAIVASFSIACHYACGFKYVDPGVPGVTFGDNKDGQQYISVDENNAGGAIVIAFLVEVQGELFVTPIRVDHRLELSVIDDDQTEGRKIVTVHQFDYDTMTPDAQLIGLTDSNNASNLILKINNIEDESPELSPGICKMEEHANITVDNSECIFTISDQDGFLNRINFSDIIDISTNTNSVFRLAYKVTPHESQKTSDVYLVLKEGATLDYESTMLYNLLASATDQGGHFTKQAAHIVVHVEDIADQPPVWETFVPVLKVAEEAQAHINVLAIDGDFGINSEINYKLSGDTEFIEIVSNNGTITVKPIDREAGHESVVFQVTAFEKNDANSSISGQITLIVDDIDDSIPEITVPGSEKKLDIIMEENPTELYHALVIVDDEDLGENAMYDIVLQNPGEVDYASAFQISPSGGLGISNISLVIKDPSKFDYENKDWRIFSFSLVTKGTKNPNMTDTLPITVTLTDVNDEYPEFGEEEYTATVFENIPKDSPIIIIKATDKDAEDAHHGVTYELLGSHANSVLRIDALEGLVSTNHASAFDYEFEKEVIFRVQAKDTVNHTTVTTLTITVEDLNDENPILSVSSSYEIQENRQEGTIVNTDINAFDEDQMADLEFSIDWAGSYATKNSVKLTEEEFGKYHCLNVVTIQEGTQEAIARLSIKETVPNNTPDYEIFDTLYVKLVVTDKTTQINEGQATAFVVINIIDVDEN